MKCYSYDEAKEMVRDHLEEYLMSTRGIASPKQKFNCINPAHADAHPSMSINPKDRKHCHCFSCGANYDLFDVIAIDYGLTDPAEIFRKGYELYGIEVEGSQPAYKIDTPAPAESKEKYYKECMARIGQSSYLQERGISPATAEKYMLGIDPSFKAWLRDDEGNSYSEIWEALIIPVTANSYVARNTNKAELNKKKRYQKRGSACIYNINGSSGPYKAEAPVYVVEGELDALSIIEAGGNAIALGSTSNVNQLASIFKAKKPTQPLILALDEDEEGQKAEAELAQKLSELGIIYYQGIDICNGHKDANEALLADREAFSEAVKAGEKVEDMAKELEKEEYLNNSVANHLQDFINGIAESVNTPCISTGYPKLDSILDGGLYEGLYIVGAVTSLGKTTFVLQLADQIAQRGTDVLIFSLEMARSELMAKSISRHTILDVLQNRGNVRDAKTNRGISSGSRWAGYSTAERELISRAIKSYSSYANHIFIYEGVGDIGVAQIRELVKRHISITGNRPVVIIDYVQILAPADVRASDKQNTDKAILELKRLSRDHKIPVVGISSLNRESYRQNKRISMEDFKESGAIEYGSDVLIGLQFKGAGTDGFKLEDARARSPREVELVILKNRNGDTSKSVFYEYYQLFNYFNEEQ